jgi:hypothetical protein
MLGHYTTAPDAWEHLFSLARDIIPDWLRSVKPSGCQFWRFLRFLEKAVLSVLDPHRFTVPCATGTVTESRGVCWEPRIIEMKSA